MGPVIWVSFSLKVGTAPPRKTTKASDSAFLSPIFPNFFNDAVYLLCELVLYELCSIYISAIFYVHCVCLSPSIHFKKKAKFYAKIIIVKLTATNTGDDKNHCCRMARKVT